MPKVKLAPVFEEIHGTMYDPVFKKSPKGDMIVTKKSDMSKVKWSEAQKANPKVRLKYEHKAKKQGRRARDLAMSDCLKGKDLYAER